MFLVMLMFGVCYGFNSNGSVRVNVNHDYLPDYEIPRWVYKKVFNHNKMSSMESSKLKEKIMQYEQKTEYIDEYIDEYDATYNMLIKLQMPLAFIQPINNII
tara:strand:+ start:1054 stop:1359 length:306 start_codon:yes stop_codon:yes gene_type:complete